MGRYRTPEILRELEGIHSSYTKELKETALVISQMVFSLEKSSQFSEKLNEIQN